MPRYVGDVPSPVDTMAIVHPRLEAHRRVESLEHIARDLDPGDHTGLRATKTPLLSAVLGDARVGGDVPLRPEVLGEGATDHLDVVGTKHQLTAVICALVGSIRVRCSCIGSGSG